MTSYSWRPVRLSVVGSLLIGGMIGCGSDGTPEAVRARYAARGSGDVVIGVAWPWAKRREIRYGEGLDLAVEEVNAAGGINGRKLRLVRADDAESVDAGRRVADRFAGDPSIVAVIGHLQSFVSVPASAIYDMAGLVMISPTSTDPELTAHGYSRVFRSTYTVDEVGGQLADFAAAQGYRRIAIEYIRSQYGRSLANAFEERANTLGLSVLARQSYDPSDSITSQAFAATAEEWRRLDLQAIVVAGEVPTAAHFIVQTRRAGITVPMLGGDAMGSVALVSVGGTAVEGTVVAAPFHPGEDRPEVHRFVTAFRHRFGLEPDAGSALGYDAVRLLAHAMQRARSSSSDEIARYLHTMPGWQGVTGKLQFADNGDLIGSRIVKTIVRDGRLTYLPDSGTVGQAASRDPTSTGPVGVGSK